MNATGHLSILRIASPCPTNWEKMAGDDRVRFCDLCHLHVYNLAGMTRKEVWALVAKSEGRICARLYRRADGTIITKDCPEGSRAIRRRVAKAAGAVFATITGLCSMAIGQQPSPKDTASCKQQVKITRKLVQSSSDNGVISGTILDPNGALVAGAEIRITDQKTKKSRKTKSNDEGHFLMAGLTTGAYDISIKLPGFKSFEMKKVTLVAREIVGLDLVLLLDGTSVTVGILVDTPLIDTSTPGTIIIRGEMLRRLPIP